MARSKKITNARASQLITQHQAMIDEVKNRDDAKLDTIPGWHSFSRAMKNFLANMPWTSNHLETMRQMYPDYSDTTLRKWLREWKNRSPAFAQAALGRQDDRMAIFRDLSMDLAVKGANIMDEVMTQEGDQKARVMAFKEIKAGLPFQTNRNIMTDVKVQMSFDKAPTTETEDDSVEVKVRATTIIPGEGEIIS